MAIKVDGVKQTVAAFSRYERAAGTACRGIVERAVARTLARAQGLVAVGTQPGPWKTHVRDQIRSQMAPDSAFGAVFVERRGIGGYWGTDNVGVWLEHGTYRTRAQPFMGPAVEPERVTLMGELARALDGAGKEF